jgi:hypothetical protein
MDEKVNVPYVVHEADMARMERGNKRLSILATVLVALLFITNALWVWLWNQYEYVDTVTTSVSQDGEGNNIYGDGNEVTDGADSNDNGN